MASYFERYLAGEHHAVWAELTNLGDRISEPGVYDEVLEVVYQAMKEASSSHDGDKEALGLVVAPLNTNEQDAALPLMIRLLGTPNRAIRCFVLASLTYGLRHNDNPYIVALLAPVFDQLLAQLADDHAAVRQQAAQLLGFMRSPQASAPLTHALLDEEPAVRAAVVIALGRLRAVESLMLALGDADASVRRDAIYTLGDIGDVQAIVPLIQVLKGNPEESVIVAVVHALEWLGGQPVVAAAIGEEDKRQALISLLRMLTAEAATSSIREEGAEAIGMIGGEQMVSVLAAHLSSNNVSVRRSAIRGMVATRSQQAVSILREQAGSTSGERQYEAQRALREMDRQGVP